MKRCFRCKITKSVKNFYKSSYSKDLLASYCKTCEKERRNPEKLKEYLRKWKLKNPELYKIYERRYYLSNIEKVKKRTRQWQRNNPEKNKENRKKYREKNKEKRNAYNRKYGKRNKDKINAFMRNKRRTNISFKLHGAMRNLLKRILSLTKQNKENRTTEILGYTPTKLRQKLEMGFTDAMNWKNYGIYWVIDHKIPVNYFIKKKITNPKIINCLCNLQPLSRIDNILKSNKFESSIKK